MACFLLQIITDDFYENSRTSSKTSHLRTVLFFLKSLRIKCTSGPPPNNKKKTISMVAWHILGRFLKLWCQYNYIYSKCEHFYQVIITLWTWCASDDIKSEPLVEDEEEEVTTCSLASSSNDFDHISWPRSATDSLTAIDLGDSRQLADFSRCGIIERFVFNTDNELFLLLRFGCLCMLCFVFLWVLCSSVFIFLIICIFLFCCFFVTFLFYFVYIFVCLYLSPFGLN